MFNQGGISLPQGSSNGESSENFESAELQSATPTQTQTQWQSQNAQQQGQSQSATPNTDGPAPAPAPNPPLQKRRRVTRACDECRRKKIKCDGKQPCTHCTVYSYECTFDQPSNRRRNPAPQYFEALEKRLQRAEALLKTFLPNIDLNDPNIDVIVRQRKAALGQTGLPAESVRSEGSRPGSSDPGVDEEEDDPKLSSMIETTGQLEIDERGQFDFHGGSSGAVFLQRMREQFDGLLGGRDSKTPFLPRLQRTPTQVMLESPHAAESPFESGLPNTMDLPPRETAQRLAANALQRACALLKFVHEPSFYKMFNRIYDTPAEAFGDEENRFLPLLYVVLALGCMFMDDEEGKNSQQEVSYTEGIDQGLKYFKAARAMMDITDCRDITSLQAVLFMILFLQSSANLSTCYSYIGIALRSALRIGLHRNLAWHFTPIERETRRRVFWIIRKMDTYVAALLGFPKMLNDEDVDQELPLEVDDEYITEKEILPMPEGKLSVFTASNAHTRLMAILAKVIRDIYPIKAVESAVPGSSPPTYTVSHGKIKEIECDLQDWLDKLPMGLRPGGDAPEDVVRVQQLLRMAYAHVQMMLYRPFLHYVSPKSNVGRVVDDRSYACAAACVSVSRNVVHITAEMQRRGLLLGAYWFTMYTTFFAILSLAFFVLENPTKPGTEEVLANASAGRDALKALAKRSMAADRCSTALAGLFEQLRNRLRESRIVPEKSNKRRSYPASTLPVTLSSPNIPAITQRSLTFPIHPIGGNLNRSKTEKPRSLTPSTLTDPTLRKVFGGGSMAGDLASPLSTSFSATETPTSDGTATNSPASALGILPKQETPQSITFNNYQDQFVGDQGLTNLSAMMFPSADPFAYPNQPMMEYDNRQHNRQNLGTDMPPQPFIPTNNTNSNAQMLQQNMFLSNSNQSQPMNFDNLEGQIFPPLPPYMLNQGQTDLNMMNVDLGTMNGANFQHTFNPTAGNMGNMGFDNIFTGTGDEWDQLLVGDQLFKAT